MSLLDGLPHGTYRVLYADPPWKMSMGTKSRPQHYPRMTIAEIKALPVKALAHPEGCRLFLWTTAPLLDRFPEILSAWGFKHCSVRTWVKLWPSESGMFVYRDSIARGTGYEVQGNAEFLVIGKRGRPQSIKGAPWSSVVMEPRREHSRKPASIRDEIARRLEGPRLEMFARTSSPGWDVAGNETTKFGSAA
jgi:N6-adenosine-specific RNA methylase IME4